MIGKVYILLFISSATAFAPQRSHLALDFGTSLNERDIERQDYVEATNDYTLHDEESLLKRAVDRVHAKQSDEDVHSLRENEDKLRQVLHHLEEMKHDIDQVRLETAEAEYQGRTIEGFSSHSETPERILDLAHLHSNLQLEEELYNQESKATLDQIESQLKVEDNKDHFQSIQYQPRAEKLDVWGKEKTRNLQSALVCIIDPLSQAIVWKEVRKTAEEIERQLKADENYKRLRDLQEKEKVNQRMQAASKMAKWEKEKTNNYVLCCEISPLSQNIICKEVRKKDKK